MNHSIAKHPESGSNLVEILVSMACDACGRTTVPTIRKQYRDNLNNLMRVHDFFVSNDYGSNSAAIFNFMTVASPLN